MQVSINNQSRFRCFHCNCEVQRKQLKPNEQLSTIFALIGRMKAGKGQSSNELGCERRFQSIEDELKAIQAEIGVLKRKAVFTVI